jgi:hypothetical protein
MKKIYTTAQGKQVDIDGLRVANEHTIAVGNMKVNARGDELGPGGSVATTRNQQMEAYYKLNSQVAIDATVPDEIIKRQRQAGATVSRSVAPVAAPPVEPAIEEDTNDLPEVFSAPEATTPATAPAPTTRGSLAGSVAKNATVTQELLKPLNKRNGITRI